MFGLGLPEVAVMAVIGLLLFGPSKFPQLGRGLGEAISGFKKSLSEDSPSERIEK